MARINEGILLQEEKLKDSGRTERGVMDVHVGMCMKVRACIYRSWVEI